MARAWKEEMFMKVLRRGVGNAWSIVSQYSKLFPFGQAPFVSDISPRSHPSKSLRVRSSRCEGEEEDSPQEICPPRIINPPVILAADRTTHCRLLRIDCVLPPVKVLDIGLPV